MMDSRQRASLAPELLVVAGYVLLTLLFTYPLGLHLNSMVVGLAVDAESHMWSYWWMCTALRDLHTNPFVTTRLYYPEGVSLYFYAYNVVHAIVSIPLQSLFGLIVAYNLTELLGFFNAAWAMYWLARDITGDRRASFVAGIAFGFAPLQVFHFNVGQPNLHGVEFLPVYVLCIRRWLRGDRSRWLLGSALALALNSFSDWQYALYAELFTLVLLVALFIEQRHTWRTALWNLGWRTAAVQAVYAITVAPVLLPMIQELRMPHPYMYRSRRDTIYHSADLLSFFVPNPMHPLWRDWAMPLFDSFKPPGILLAFVSLSYVVLVLATIALLRRWKESRFWVWCGLVFLVLSLGPQLRMAGEVTNIPLPYEFLYQFSVLRVSRAPARYFVITLLCLSVLAAMGTTLLRERWTQMGERGRTWIPTASFLGVVLLLCFELLPIPSYASASPPVPGFFTDGTLQGAGALWEWPNPSNRGMYYATIHELPVLYGEMSRDNPPGPVLNYLRNGLARKEIGTSALSWNCVANFYHVTHLVVYHDPRFEATNDERSTMKNEILPTLPLVQDTPLASLYRVPPAETGDSCIIVGEGWNKPRPFGPDQPLYRWMGQQGTLGLLRHTPGHIVLHFDAHSFATPRHLEVSLGETVVGHVMVNQRESFSLEMDVPAGVSWLRLRSVEPASSPADYGYKDETEPVSVGISEVWIEER